jgi:hypothetical protein
MNMKYIFLINLVSCVFMTGLIWCIQVVHYPLFENVGKESFPTYHSLHSIRITYIVLPVMCAEILTSFLLLGENDFMSANLSWVLFGMVLAVWASTFFLQVPMHGVLSSGIDIEAIHRLVNTNWVRTFFWTARTVLLSILLVKNL